MKPENRAESEQSGDRQSQRELTRTEGSSNKAFELNELKGQTGLSNKKWDKAIKGLTKNKVAKVEKTEGGLLVSLV